MSWLDRYRSLEWRHQAAANKAVAGPIRDFYATPPVGKNKLLDEVPIVALDFETTGLNAEKDHIISLGLIEMQHRKIRLNTAWHQLVRTDKELPSESVVIHNITDDDLSCARCSSVESSPDPDRRWRYRGQARRAVS